MSRQLPLPVPTVLSSNGASYLTEQRALTEVGGLRALYAGHGLSEIQRSKLEAAVQQAITNIKDIYFIHSYSPITVHEQREVRAMIEKAKGVITKVSAERRERYLRFSG